MCPFTACALEVWAIPCLANDEAVGVYHCFQEGIWGKLPAVRVDILAHGPLCPTCTPWHAWRLPMRRCAKKAKQGSRSRRKQQRWRHRHMPC